MVQFGEGGGGGGVRVLCSALGLSDVVFKKRNNLRHETQPLFPVYSNGQFRSMSKNCQLLVQPSPKCRFYHLQNMSIHVSTDSSSVHTFSSIQFRRLNCLS